MTKKLNLLILSVLISIALFVYLTVHHYAIKLGLGGSALCSISQTINCDAAALSPYAEFFHIPIALLGAAFQTVLLGLLVFYRLRWVDDSIYLKRTLQFMLGLSAVVSIVMALISFFVVKVMCPFCFGTYLFSFISLFLGWNLIPTDKNQKFDIQDYFGEYKSHLILLALIPATAWIASAMIQENYGLAELTRIVPEKLAQWRNSAHYDFDKQLGLNNKVSSDKIVLVEFADFKCPHCKVASQTIDTFLKNRTDVQFIFKPFPLDGTCNSSEQIQKGDGTRCTLAAWALCAEKLAQKGFDVHHWIFEKQEEISGISDLSSLLPEIETKFQIKASEMTTCAQSSETYEQIRKSSEEGHKAKVSGTPTIYLNGKKLNYGHIMEVLKSAVAEVE